MSSITTWMRLEPGSRTGDMSSGLQARIYDPLWLLARQWQVGEFQGEDNGSPATSSATTSTSWLNVNNGDGGFNAINPNSPNDW